MVSAKKHEKTAAKLEKKRAKAQLKARKEGSASAGGEERPSPAVRFAEAVRGVLYVVAGLSLLAALLLGQRGVFVSLDDVIDSLFVVRAGKVALALVGIALLVYGLKHLRLVR